MFNLFVLLSGMYLGATLAGFGYRSKDAKMGDSITCHIQQYKGQTGFLFTMELYNNMGKSIGNVTSLTGVPFTRAQLGTMMPGDATPSKQELKDKTISIWHTSVDTVVAK